MEDDRLIQLALSRGYITPSQIERAKAEQKSLADRGIDHSVFFLLQDLGLLSEEQARDLRKHASSSAVRALEVDGFVIQGRIGSGGMGDVFRARHPDGREAAVKLLSGKLARSEEYVRRFLREARATTRLLHPNIVATLGAGEAMGTRYMLMELVDGPSLKTWLVDHGKLAPAHALVVLRQITAALHYAWDHGVLHRDVKPANIILGKPRPGHDEPFCAKLCDFGLARVENLAGEAELSHGGLTGTGLALGTPHYMSPEQASGEHDVDQRSDIYGLGATLYHALLGQTLYSGKSSAVIMYKQVTETVDLGNLRNAGVREPLVALLGRMLAKRRVDRIATWTEVEAETARLSGHPAAPVAPAPVKPVSSSIRLGQRPAAAPRPPTTTLLPTALPQPSAPPRVGPGLIIGTAIAIALVAAAVVGLLLGGGQRTVTATPESLGGALGAIATQPEERREIILAPGSYRPMRLGAAHRGLRLRAAGSGVVVRGVGGNAAIACDPGLDGARIIGVELSASPGRSALELTAGCRLQVEDAALRGDLLVSGGSLHLLRCTVAGRILVSDRGSLEVGGGRIAGLLVERGDCRLGGVAIIGQAEVRSGSIDLDGVRIGSATAPALRLDRARAILHDVLVDAPGVGIEAHGSELPAAEGLTVRGLGPSLLWEGDRGAAWRWSGFELATPPRGLPAAIPAGPGAHLERLPPP